MDKWGGRTELRNIVSKGLHPSRIWSVFFQYRDKKISFFLCQTKYTTRSYDTGLYNVPEGRRCHVPSGGTYSVIQNAKIASGAHLSSYSMSDGFVLLMVHRRFFICAGNQLKLRSDLGSTSNVIMCHDRLTNLTFRWPRIVINSYNKTN